MNPKKPKQNSLGYRSETAQKLANETKQLADAGYVAMPTHALLGERVNSSSPQWVDVLNGLFTPPPTKKDGKESTASPNGDRGEQMFASSGVEVQVSDKGTPQLGYIEWGPGNQLPNRIALLSSLLPYTAAGVKFNTDTAAGLGIVPKYHYSFYSNGSIVTKEIDYKDAGKLLEAKLMEVSLALGKFYSECREKGIDLKKKLSFKTDQPQTEEEEPDNVFPSISGKEEDAQKSANETEEKKPDSLTIGAEPVENYAANNGRDAEDGETANPAGTLPPTDAEIRIAQYTEQRLLRQIAIAEHDYNTWENTNAELEEFMKENNMARTGLKLFNDMVLYGICFPELQLSLMPKEKDDRKWMPKVRRIVARDALTCRLERMDENNRINYVYVSNQWLNFTSTSGAANTTIASIPALSPDYPSASLTEGVRRFRLDSAKARGKEEKPERPTRFIFPVSYPSAGRPYYPQPSWWSLFGGRIYQYASTLIEDRANSKENSTMWGKIVYIHTEYLQKLYMQLNLKTTEEQEKARDEIWDEINRFLKEKSNNGKTLLSFMFTGIDGKEHEAYKIVDVPQATKNSAEAQQTELSEVTSIIFFVMEIHPGLIGAEPGASRGKSGTYQREMYEIKKVQMSMLQQLVLQAYDTARNFNDWDSHLTFKVKSMTLTTLDRNKDGVEETNV